MIPIHTFCILPYPFLIKIYKRATVFTLIIFSKTVLNFARLKHFFSVLHLENCRRVGFNLSVYRLLPRRLFPETQPPREAPQSPAGGSNCDPGKQCQELTNNQTHIKTNQDHPHLDVRRTMSISTFRSSLPSG